MNLKSVWLKRVLSGLHRLWRIRPRPRPWRWPDLFLTQFRLSHPLDDGYRLVPVPHLKKGRDPKPRLRWLVHELPAGSHPPALYLLVCLRELLEYRGWKEVFPITNLFANWSVHTRIQQSAEGFDLLARINATINEPPGSPESLEGLRRAISEELNATVLRHELRKLFKREGLRVRFLDSHGEWRSLLFDIIEQVRGKPIQFPDGPLRSWRKKTRRAYELSRTRIEKKTGNTGMTVTGFVVDYHVVPGQGRVLHWFCFTEGGVTIMSQMHPDALEPPEVFKTP